ncbi:endonuclease domain-containing protein [Sphingomonas sp. CLY1604]|uniref:endonuclease domain-containing protein n=1 Tax=Sphingomonas sp. CLY1604 TaxID=3457786 RepID=UPI003FD719ED
MKLGGSKQNLADAKGLRRTLTLPEIILWRELRQLPVRVRKQVPADPYVLDFYCAKARLVIEVDGEAHSRGNRPCRDAARDAWLAERGIATLRIPAVDVLRKLDAVMRLILAELAARGTTPSTTR